MCSGVGWARGRMPAGSGCRGRTVGGYSAASPLVRPVVASGRPAEGDFWGVPHPWGHHCVLGRRSAGCGGLWGWGLCRCRPCVWRRCVVCRPRRLLLVVCCGGAWGVVLGFAVPGRVRDMRGWAGWGGGARVCGLACLPSVPPVAPSSACPLLLSFSLACLALFFLGGGGGGSGAVRGCGCVPVSAPGSQTARVGGCGSWLVSGWRGRAWVCVWVCSWRGLMGWWAVWAWLVCVGVGYVCAEGAVGWAGAPWAMQWVEVMLVTPTGGCCRRRNGSVLLTWVLRVTRRAATGLVTLLVS